MNYEKKYKEALERAKEFVSKDVVEALEYIFPELAESEDERIRKAIYNALKYLELELSWDFLDEVDILDVYAWLEKQDWLEKQEQGDSKKVSIWKHWKDGICGNGEGKQIYLIKKMGNTYSLSSCLGFECDYIELSELDNLMLEKQGKQKQPIWSEEDEQSKNWILEYLYDGLRRTDEQFKDEFKAAIAWFEKQGEPKPCGQSKKCSDCQFNYAGECKGSCQMKRDDQKTADKGEPKFKVGDWVVTDDSFGKIVRHVDEINFDIIDKGYVLSDENGLFYNLSFDREHKWHKWTIQDAEDGDVVVDKSDGTIGIFQSIGHYPDGGSYNDPSYCFLHCRYDDGFFYADFEHGNTIDSDDLIPATKEQRDLLFQKMKETGCEWDNRNKCLTKI